jgi:tRNA dimethylallyltransferase
MGRSDTRGHPILIAGATASGKSSLALALSAHFGGCIINADALQVYARWQILTARPGPEQEALHPHFLYGHVAERQPYSVGHWLRDVRTSLDKAASAGLRPIIVGGTGLYFNALTRGLADIPDIPPQVRAEAEALEGAEGPGVFATLLGRDDPLTSARIDRQNPARTRRAWEVWRATGVGLARWQDRTGTPLIPVERATALVLNADKSWLNPRIDRRFDQMIRQGALAECAAALAAGWDPSRASSQAIGTRELIAHLQGETTLDAAVAAARIQTHRYAKRQRSWFRSRMKDWQQVDVGKSGDLLATVLAQIAQN